MEKFTLQKDEDFIQLNDLMKVLNWVGSGGEAKQIILSEQVTVNGSIEMRVRRKLHSGDKVQWGDLSAEIS
ncbi:MAG: RNA-binding protein [Flammeovirgaceae bacterium]|nr:RNA-binding protein [Flammeovirgaceae bacterium]MBE61819.1 RNA-binding protein [Flammeovirgaceae bacterium]|tara:strand:+ start:94 stop:306 length:213 start_codon:yes stop_codon:yes gene_type:complete